MSAQISGKQWATRITTAVTAASLAAAGIAAVAVDMATTSHAATSNTVTSQDKDTKPPQSSDEGQDQGYPYRPDPVQPGNGGAVTGRSSGS